MSTAQPAPPRPKQPLNLILVWKTPSPPEPYPADSLPSEAIKLYLQRHAPYELDELDRFQLSDPDSQLSPSEKGLRGLDPRKPLNKNGVLEGGTLILTKSVPHYETSWDKGVAVGVGVYTFIVFLVALTALVSIWPATPADLSLNATRSITLPFTLLDTKVTLGPEVLLVTTMILAGMVGACIFSFYAISLHLGYYKDFDDAWLAWYLLRPLMGAGLALIAYVLIRGGVLSVGSDLKNVNFLGVSGISFLVGLFAEQFLLKLHALADELFGKPPSETPTQETVQPAQSASA